MQKRIVMGLVALIGMTLGACTVKNQCDDDQIAYENLCAYPPSAGGATGDGPSFDASCASDDDCTGGTVCGASEGFPICIGLCGPGDPFEDGCPEDKTCFEAQPDVLVCI